MADRKKILVLSDHAMSTSGVGCQTRHLINGLLDKSDDWTFRQFGAAMKHANYDTVAVNENFIMPIDLLVNNKELRVTPSKEFSSLKIKKHSQVEVMDWKFYVKKIEKK